EPESSYDEGPGPGRRLLAFLIDGAACSLVARLFTHPPSSAYTLAVTGIFVVERIVFTTLTGSSFGQRILGIRVVRAGGARADLRAATIRTLMMLPLLIPVFLVDKSGRGLHDRLAGTVEIRA